MQFETKRLILRPRTMDDFEDCLAMDRAPGVVDFIPGPWDDDQAHRDFVTARINQDFGHGLGYWSIFARKRPDQFVGWILLIPNNGVGPEIEIGWRLHPDYQGQGIGSEAAGVIADHAMNRLNLDRIIAGIDRRNHPSCRVAEKLGMQAQAEDDGYVMYELSRLRYRSA